MTKYILGLVFALVVGIGVGYSFKPENKIQEIEVIKKDVVTVVKEVVKKDGSKEVTTVIKDNSKEEKQTIQTLNPEKLWKATAIIQRNFREEVYQFSIERKVFKNVWVGVNASNKGFYGVSVGVEF